MIITCLLIIDISVTLDTANGKYNRYDSDANE